MNAQNANYSILRGEILTVNNRVAPLMVDKKTAASICSLPVAAYDRYARKNLLPPMNQVGRISVEALRRAVGKLDGEEDSNSLDPDTALSAWETSDG